MECSEVPAEQEGRKEMLYLTTHSAHFIYSDMVSAASFISNCIHKSYHSEYFFEVL